MIAETPEEEKKRKEAGLPDPSEKSTTEEEEFKQMLKAKLPEFSAKVDKSTIYPAEFEKDDETNFHVDFVHAFSCLRARNY